MKYEELSDKDKVRLILQHVIPHEIADDIVFNGRHIVIERRWTKDNPVKPIDWPVAAWDDAAEVWWTRDIASNWDTAFDPLHDFNDAWLVLKKFYEDHQDGELFSPLAYHLGITWYEQAYNSKVFQMNLEQLVNLTPEKLCVAILKTLQVSIEASE